MKKQALRVLAGVLSMLLAGGMGTGFAAVTGVCSNCHTMHNSQEGSPMRPGGETAPLSALLLNTCLGCHTTDASDPLDDSHYPFVMSSSNAFNDNNCLAGGFFTPETVDTQDNNSDMNHTLGSRSLPAGYAPDESLGDWYAGDTEDSGLTCAGNSGCHGVHNVPDDMQAISGGHHNPNSYRILYVDSDTTTGGVSGVGASDYEEALIRTPDLGDPRNTYSAGVNDPSISELCAICHGNFHNEAGSPEDSGGGANPWIRHPTDVDIPDTWVIGDEATYELTASDYKNNPVGHINADPNGQRMVTCLSCHRAHGTENNDLLRWAYDTQNAGSFTAYGCLGCHDKQR